MAVRLGSTDITKFYLGSTQLTQLYLGTVPLLGGGLEKGDPLEAVYWVASNNVLTGDSGGGGNKWRVRNIRAVLGGVIATNHIDVFNTGGWSNPDRASDGNLSNHAETNNNITTPRSHQIGPQYPAPEAADQLTWYGEDTFQGMEEFYIQTSPDGVVFTDVALIRQRRVAENDDETDYIDMPTTGLMGESIFVRSILARWPGFNDLERNAMATFLQGMEDAGLIEFIDEMFPFFATDEPTARKSSHRIYSLKDPGLQDPPPTHIPGVGYSWESVSQNRYWNAAVSYGGYARNPRSTSNNRGFFIFLPETYEQLQTGDIYFYNMGNGFTARWDSVNSRLRANIANNSIANFDGFPSIPTETPICFYREGNTAGCRVGSADAITVSYSGSTSGGTLRLCNLSGGSQNTNGYRGVMSLWLQMDMETLTGADTLTINNLIVELMQTLGLAPSIQAQAVLDRLPNLNSKERDAVTTFVDAMVDAGLWAKATGFWCFSLLDDTDMITDWIDDVAPLTIFGTPDNIGAQGVAFAEIPEYYRTPNGANTYLPGDTGTLLLFTNNFGFGATASDDFFGARNADTSEAIRLYYRGDDSGDHRARLNTTTELTAGTVKINNDIVGVQFDGATLKSFFGEDVHSVAATPTAGPATALMQINGLNNNGVNSTITTAEASFFGIFEDDLDVAAFRTIAQQLLIDLGKAGVGTPNEVLAYPSLTEAEKTALSDFIWNCQIDDLWDNVIDCWIQPLTNEADARWSMKQVLAELVEVQDGSGTGTITHSPGDGMLISNASGTNGWTFQLAETVNEIIGLIGSSTVDKQFDLAVWMSNVTSWGGGDTYYFGWDENNNDNRSRLYSQPSNVRIRTVGPWDNSISNFTAANDPVFNGNPIVNTLVQQLSKGVGNQGGISVNGVFYQGPTSAASMDSTKNPTLFGDLNSSNVVTRVFDGDMTSRFAAVTHFEGDEAKAAAFSAHVATLMDDLNVPVIESFDPLEDSPEWTKIFDTGAADSSYSLFNDGTDETLSSSGTAATTTAISRGLAVSADIEMEVDWLNTTSPAGNSWAFPLACRMTADGNTGVFLRTSGANAIPELQLQQRDAGTWGTTYAINFTGLLPGKVKLQVIGSTMKVFIDDNEVMSETTTVLAAGHYGVRHATQQTITGELWKNLVVTEL